jgi:hypothetical protein
MPYHPLSSDSGGDELSRITEAHTICRMLEEFYDQMNDKEKGFIEQMTDCDYCSVKQIFYLRDIKERYL